VLRDKEAVVLVFDLVVFLEAAPLFGCLSQAVEVMLASCHHCCLCLGSQSSVLPSSIALCLVTPANRPEVAAHPWSCRATRHYQLVPSAMGGCYEPSCNILPQPLAPASSWRAEVVHHLVAQVWTLFLAFVRCLELLFLQVFARYHLAFLLHF
jgi:hypothetical protein